MMPRYGLGRLVAPDPRDARYPMRLALDLAAPLPTSRHWVTGPVLDQDTLPHCVGFAWAQWLMTSPTRTRTGPSPAEIYHAAQKVDEWPGEAYDGTSVRAAAKVMTDLGRMANYVWAQSVDELRRWLLLNGPVVLGTSWLEEMFEPDRHGFLTVAGAEAGGHAYLCCGWSNSAAAFRCINSWGRGWGQNGRFWLRPADLGRLLEMQGEACAALERPLVP